MFRNGFKTVITAGFCLLFMQAMAAAAPGHTTGNVNMRSGPGADYQKIATLPAGARVDIGRCVSNWCSVRALGVSGWVSANYVQRSGWQRPVVIAPTIVIRPPHRPRPPHWQKPGRPTCRIAPGYPCPR